MQNHKGSLESELLLLPTNHGGGSDASSCTGTLCLARFAVGAGRARPVITSNYSGIPRFDAGVQFTGIQLNGPIVAGDQGVGLHFGYNFNSYLSLESNVNAFHLGTRGQLDSHTTEVLFGPRIGYTSREAGIYVKVLPGFIHFPRASDQATTPLNPLTNFALDTGVVVLRYFPNHVYVRFDGGATIINYGSGSFVDPASGQRVHLGIRGTPAFSFGVGAHF